MSRVWKECEPACLVMVRWDRWGSWGLAGVAGRGLAGMAREYRLDRSGLDGM